MCFLLLTNGTTQGQHLMTSGTNCSGSGIGDKLIQKAQNVVKIWSQHGTILVNFSFEHKNQTPAPRAPGSDPHCGQPQRHHAGAPSQRYQATGNNYMTPPQLTISLHAGRYIFIPRNLRNRFGITCKQTQDEPLIGLKTCNVE